MISILMLGSIVAWDVCQTSSVMLGSSFDTNSITFFVLQSPIIADV